MISFISPGNDHTVFGREKKRKNSKKARKAQGHHTTEKKWTAKENEVKEKDTKGEEYAGSGRCNVCGNGSGNANAMLGSRAAAVCFVSCSGLTQGNTTFTAPIDDDTKELACK